MPRKAVYFAVPVLLSLAGSISLVGSRGEAQKSQTAMPSLTASPVLGQTPPAAASAKSHTLFDEFGRVPVFFVPNRGQTDNRVGFYVQGANKTIYFASDGLTLALSYPGRSGSSDEPKRWTVKLDFLGARKDVKPEGLEKTGATLSYFRGKPEEWRSGLPAYSKIVYRDLWPGIDLVYKGGLDRLKYEFIVHPGADPTKIKLAYRGVDKIALTAEGRLDVSTRAGAFEDDVPLAYQEIDGQHTNVAVAYAVEPVAAGAERRPQAYGFAVGEYDRSRTLVLDPIVLVYCGYIGGSGGDYFSGIAVDALGNAYVTGQVASDDLNFPAAVGPDLGSNGGMDAFIAKVDPSGQELVYCGYIGGSGGDTGSRVCVDGWGNAYITGYTASGEASFPVIAGPDLNQNGQDDAFVAKVDASGTTLLYCGYIGGAGLDYGHGIAVDGSGNAYVTGITQSAAATFPVKIGPDLTHNDNGTWGDAFVAKVDASGTSLVYCGYIGGNVNDFGLDIAVDGSGYAYITGITDSLQSTFPLKNGPDLTGESGWGDAFVAKLDASGASLIYCGYIGGEGIDRGNAIAVNAAGEAFVTGYTGSPEIGVVGPNLLYNGQLDAFVAKVNSSGTAFVYLGYIGGTGSDAGMGIAVDSAGNAYVTGVTVSSESGERQFPVLDGPDLTYNGGSKDAFVAEVNSSGTALVYCGYIGGAAGDGGYGIAVDGSGYAYVSGCTDSSEDTFPVVGGPILTRTGAAFVAKVGDVPGPPITSLLPDSANAGDPGFLLSVIGSEFVDGAVVRWDGTARPTTFISGSELQATIEASDLAAGKTVQVTVRNPNGGISNPLPFTISNPAPTLSSLSTTRVTGGSAAFPLTVQGSNFVPNSIVRWNGNDRATTYVNGTELQAVITTTDLATGGSAQVTVFNPAPAGGTSGALAVDVSSFTLSSSPSRVTVTAGQSATYTVTLTPQFGSFDAAVTFACAGLPGRCTATFSPSSATPGAAAVTTTLTLTTTATSRASGTTGVALSGTTGYRPPTLGLVALVLALLTGNVFCLRLQRRVSSRWLVACAIICLVVLIGSCSSGGDGNNTGTPKGTHTISVQGTSGNMTVPTSITLVVN